MARLKTVQPRIGTTTGRNIKAVPVVADRRMSGRKLQERRKTIWMRSPICAMCQRVVPYPHGFELDHKIPLFMGGEDVEDNCQVLCVWFEMVDGIKVKYGCHEDKTRAESKG